jgi:DNA-binding MarR family transcriptional regulator
MPTAALSSPPRARLITEADAARRRVVRDLHDGAQQRLVHTVISLELAQRALGADGGAAGPLVADALVQAHRANEELRELSHGILPADLTGGGLRGGVDALAERLDLAVAVDLPSERFVSEIEASAYKIFPIVGSALMTIGLLLLSRLGSDTRWLDASLTCSCSAWGSDRMQVTVIATQNAVDYKDLGAATSGVTYFRSMGGSFGTTVFGSIVSSRLSASLALYLGGTALPAGVSSETLSPDALSRLSPAAHDAVIHAYADAADRIPGRGAGRRRRLPDLVAAAGAQAAKDARRRRSRPDVGMPTDRGSAQELERGLGVLAEREDRVALYRRIAAQAGLSGLRPAASCLLARLADHGGVTRADLAEQIGTSTANLAPSLDQLASRELVTIEPSTQVLNLSRNGQSAVERLRRAREDGLRELLDDWSPEQVAELDVRLKTLARDCIDQDAAKLRHDEGLREAA